MSSVLSVPDLAYYAPSWRALRYFSLYRITLAGAFAAAAMSGAAPESGASPLHREFAVVAWSYLALACMLQLAIENQQSYFKAHVTSQVVVDTVMLTLLMAASGGITSGLGMLLGVSVAWGSFLTSGQTALPFAAIASLLILGEEWYRWGPTDTGSPSYTQAGLLGSVLFAIALLSHALARRIGQTEALAAQQSVDLANLSRLNEHIVHRMRSGVLVLDSRGRVQLANDSASALLGLAKPLQDQSIGNLVPELVKPLTLWYDDHNLATHLVRPASRDKDLLVSITELGNAREDSILLFIEDAALMRQRAQQLKLASLGRLTASIAHEIRNPLGAISHAGQLLRETSLTDAESVRLTAIILEHSKRVNSVIESVLKIGRSNPPTPRSFALRPLLTAFVAELTDRMQLPAATVLIRIDPEHLQVRMDPAQLQQVLWNLCENALRYSQGTPALELTAGVRSLNDRPYLDVIDHGCGIPAEIEDRIFEPFVSHNSTKGTGLGLFIASELCECNQAVLSLHANTTSGCTFRISFAHPDRQQWIFQ